MLKHAILISLISAPLLATARAVPPWNNPLRRTELRQQEKVTRQQSDKAVKQPLKDVIENHYLQRNPDERDEYFSRRTIIARPSKARVPAKSSRDRDPDTGTYYYILSPP